MSSDMIIARSSGLIESGIDGEMVGLHVDNGVCYGFNRTATRVWALLEQPRTFPELCEGLTTAFEVDRDTCEQHLRPLLVELEAEKLITLTQP